jgi:hypothetical protein
MKKKVIYYVFQLGWWRDSFKSINKIINEIMIKISDENKDKYNEDNDQEDP